MQLFFAARLRQRKLLYDAPPLGLFFRHLLGAEPPKKYEPYPTPAVR
jgi:hypothetical protein